MILRTLRAHPVWTGPLALMLYQGLFVMFGLLKPSPLFQFQGSDPAGAPIPDAVQHAASEAPIKLGVAIAMVLLVLALGWWRAVGFRLVIPGGLKYVPASLALIVLVTAFSLVDEVGNGGREIFMRSIFLASFAVVMDNLLTGFTEKLMFRGILFEALRTQLRPLQTVLVTSLLFGSTHLLNLLSGADVIGTLVQVFLASILGVALTDSRPML